MTDPLLSRITALFQQVGVRADAPLVVAVSGGPDSLVLLQLLRTAVDPELLTVAHLNHGLRAQADEDAVWLAALAERWQLSFRVRREDVAAQASAAGWTLEEAGRLLRYQFLADVAHEVGASVIATGHHAGDQAETILMHLLRGSGITGLRGIQPVAPHPTDASLNLLRPMLETTRAEIEAYCAAHNLRPRDDESNLDHSLVRNRIRHELLPLLATYNPQIARHLRQLAEIATAEDDVLTGQLDAAWPTLLRQVGPSWLVLDRALLRNMPLAMQRRALRRAFAALHGSRSDLSFETLEQARALMAAERSGTESHLPGGLSILVDYDDLVLCTDPALVPTSQPQFRQAKPAILHVPGEVDLDNDWVLTTSWVSVDTAIIRANQDPWQAYLQPEKDTALCVRSRLEGETMMPLGMHGRSKALQDIFVDRRVPRRLRAGWPLVCTGDHPAWLVGHVLDQRVRVRSAAVPAIHVQCRTRAGRDPGE